MDKQSDGGRRVSVSVGASRERGQEREPRTAVLDGMGNQARVALLQRLAAPAPPADPLAQVNGRAKMAVSAPGDAAEQEADRAAAQMLAGDRAVTITATPSQAPRTPVAMVQREDDGNGGSAPADSFADSVAQMRGGGSPLAAEQRDFFEPRLGRDLGAVRLHTGAQAASAAKTVHAHAFTTANDIFFAHGQFAPHSPAGKQLLAHELAHVAQQGGASRSVQRKCDGCAEEEDEEHQLVVQRQPDDAPAPSPDDTERSAESPDQSAPQPGIVEDGEAAQPGQMTRSEFMAALGSQVTSICNAALSAIGRSADDCPYIEKYLAYYANRPAASLLRAIQVYAGAAPDADAATLMSAVVSRVAAALAVWIATGEVTGVPAGAAVDAAGAEGGTEAAGADNAGAASGGEAGAGGGSMMATVSVQAKRDAAAAVSSGDPGKVRSRLGEGRPLESGARTRMERAFGEDFGSVRVHDDPVAHSVNRDLAARAVTVGQHVAFGASEYRPGSKMGDLLLAHELAHVVQQRGARSARSTMPFARGANLEREADLAAVAALTGGNALALSSSGLKMQRCSKTGGDDSGGMKMQSEMKPTEIKSSQIEFEQILDDPAGFPYYSDCITLTITVYECTNGICVPVRQVKCSVEVGFPGRTARGMRNYPGNVSAIVAEAINGAIDPFKFGGNCADLTGAINKALKGGNISGGKAMTGCPSYAPTTH